jgi:phosphoglycerol transferase MdoB-like AlkP superfamily enzyme
MRRLNGRDAAAFVLGVIALNAALTFENVWPSLWVRPALLLSVEIALLLLVAVLYVELRGRISGAVLWAAACCLFVLSLGHYGGITTEALLGRPVNLYFDLDHVPRVLEMTVGTRPIVELALYGLVFLGLSAALLAMLRLALAAMALGLAAPLLRRVSALLAFVGVTSFVVGQATGIGVVQRSFADPVLPMFARQAHAVATAAGDDGMADEIAADMPVYSDLARLKGADVFVVFFESYGAAAHGDAAVAPRFLPRVRALEQDLGATVWRAASAYFTAPTFGSASWLSHASFLSGVTISNSRGYRQLLRSTRPTLLDTFKAAGYRTVALMPGLKRAWPEGRYYKYDQIYDARALGYGGPEFGWWAIPDQYSIGVILRQELAAPQRQPVFVLFPTVMSHIPFDPLPPYLPDWSRAASGSDYGQTPAPAAKGKTGDWSKIKNAYGESIRYDFDVLDGLLSRPETQGAVIVVMGDHQPPAIVSGAQSDWRVPVHILAQAPAVISRIAAAGFSPGLMPAGASLGSLADLHGVLAAALHSGSDPKRSLPGK